MGDDPLSPKIHFPKESAEAFDNGDLPRESRFSSSLTFSDVDSSGAMRGGNNQSFEEPLIAEGQQREVLGTYQVNKLPVQASSKRRRSSTERKRGRSSRVFGTDQKADFFDRTWAVSPVE